MSYTHLGVGGKIKRGEGEPAKPVRLAKVFGPYKPN